MKHRIYRSWVLLLTLSTVLVVSSVGLSVYADERRFAAAQPWLDLAVGDLATRLGTDIASIRTQQVEAAEFSDSSLGVPDTGEFHLPVITSGYVIRLVANGSVYEYRAGGGRLLLVDAA